MKFTRLLLLIDTPVDMSNILMCLSSNMMCNCPHHKLENMLSVYYRIYNLLYIGSIFQTNELHSLLHQKVNRLHSNNWNFWFTHIICKTSLLEGTINILGFGMCWCIVFHSSSCTCCILYKSHFNRIIHN